MEDSRVRIIANFHVSLEYNDGGYSCISETKRLWSDKNGKVTEDVVDEWEVHFTKSILETNFSVRKCNVICTSFFKLDNK